RGHTRFKCDWSSDVCSSDLYGLPCCKVKYRGVDCGVKVDREIFCDSPTAKGMMCGRTKAQALCANVLAPYSVAYRYIQITPCTDKKFLGDSWLKPGKIRSIANRESTIW